MAAIAQANEELARRGFRMSTIFGARHHGQFPDGLPWTCTLHYQRRRMTAVYYMQPGLEREPTAVEVLASLLEDVRGYEDAHDFVDFCRTFGFQRDRRRSEWTYSARGEAARNLLHVLGDEYPGVASVVPDGAQGALLLINR